VHESDDDIRELQRLLDESHAGAGEHLRSIFSEERRVPAAELPELLPGVQVLHLATVTAKCEPRVAPVDGLFFRGRFWFGSSERSLRFRNIRARPQVSATATKGEEFAVVVHGSAHEVDLEAPENRPFRDHLAEVYGTDWETWGSESPYARIDPARMFTFRFQRPGG
jgi:uncharacterized pyridoxamine 5'-phosphate oxidase family protein